jgi:hypothetical protein
MPDLGESNLNTIYNFYQEIKEATIKQWHVKVGDVVEEVY